MTSTTTNQPTIDRQQLRALLKCYWLLSTRGRVARSMGRGGKPRSLIFLIVMYVFVGLMTSMTAFTRIDLFTFTVMVGGRHVIETEGQSDVMMKLFGPNSPTLLIAADDDGGVGLNARIVANLLPGRYFAQIRHFSRTQGTGTYTISVRTYSAGHMN